MSTIYKFNQDLLSKIFAKTESVYAKKTELEEVQTQVTNLIIPTDEEIAAIFAEKLAEWIADAPEDLDTLKEIAAWIEGHAEDAAAMNAAISANAGSITTLQGLLDTLTESVENIDMSGYVVKEDGKGLSANDYTDDDKAKVQAALTEDDFAEITDDEIEEAYEAAVAALAGDTN